jgi:6-phosphogluconolactonase (cycloisomerase 2 family)
MRLLLVVAALALLRAPTARGGTILYATAASENRVDGFCLGSDGSLTPTPTTQVPTAGVQPRRLVVGTNGVVGTDGVWNVLYVMEVDRVEAFRIGRRGGLTRIGATKTLTRPNGNPLDVALSPDATKLYVPEPGRDRLVAYPLDADGAPGKDFTSCIKGPTAPRYQRMVVSNGFLYVSDASLGGRISVFPIAADGSLPEDASVCMKTGSSSTAPKPTCPCSERRRLDTPRALLVEGDTVYVESILKKRIIQFTLGTVPTDQAAGPNQQKGCPALADHQFTTPYNKKTGEPEPVCLRNETTGDALKGNFRWQSWTSATKVSLKYEDVVRSQDTLLGSQFKKARIDAFRLKNDGRLPASLTQSTVADVRGSPVGLAERDNVLYVADGLFDRVQAFHLGRNSGLPDPNPFSQTDELKNSFPNAVAIADLPEACQ